MTKNIEKENDKLPAGRVRGIKCDDTRSMTENPVYIKVHIGCREVVCQVDTGSEECVIPRRLLDEAKLEPTNCRLLAANGTTINVVGEIILSVHVGDLTIPTRFVLSNNMTEPMLGVNWLRRNRIVWDFSKNLLIVDGKMYSLIPESKESICSRVRLLEEKEMEMISLEARVRRDTENNESRRHGSEESDNKINSERQKLNLDLPVQVINRIRVSPLESQAHREVRE